METQQLDAGRVGPGLRPALVIETAHAIIGTVHEPSGQPNLAAAQARDQADVLRALAIPAGKPGALVGDFNATAEQLTKKLNVGVEVVSSGMATHQSGGSLDHAVVFNGTATVTDGTLMAGDHAQQTYVLTPKPKPTKQARIKRKASRF